MALELKIENEATDKTEMESSGKKRTESDSDMEEEEDEGLKIVGPVQPVNLLLNIF